jgi:hypothetical protein
MVLSIVVLAKHFDLTIGQFLYRVSDKLGVKSSLIEQSAFTNNFNFPIDYRINPQLTPGVRILAQVKQLTANELSEADFPADKLKSYHPCRGKQLLFYVACGVLTKEAKAIEQAKKEILSFKLLLPNAAGHYANGWRLAFAYDALKPLTSFSVQEKKIINNNIMLALKHYLILLNGSEASMWHGRTTLTAQMWITLLALDDVDESMMAYVTPHFYSMVDALTMTQAWPEGYNYWINSRAFYVVLALSGYLNGTEYDHWHDKIMTLMNKIGHWHIQATRPDWTIEPLGDEGPRIDLKDESRRVIDIIAQVTQKQEFIDYSKAIEKRHGIQSYYTDYRWGWSLFYPVKLAAEKLTAAPLAKMDVFGKDYLGQSYIRQNWLDSTTFMSFRAGSSFAHHGHYDNGHITLFKGMPLLVNGSIPGEYFGDNRLNYGIRTIAKNSLLIQRKNEIVDIGFAYRNDVADGGQRITMPLGSAITTVNDWYEKKSQSPVLAGGTILLTDNKAEYSYIKADLTKAYNSTWYDDNQKQGKLERVEREVLYLRAQDILLIRDQVYSKDENQVKVVFHTTNKPIVTDEKVLKGNPESGIITSQNKRVKIKNGNAYLTSEIIADINDIRLIGGEGYQFYVEVDGDDSVLNGENFDQGLTRIQIAKAAKWRFEINALRKEKQEIITVHRPSLTHYRENYTQVKPLFNGVKSYRFEDVVVVFTEKELNKLQLKQLSKTNLLICGLKQEKTSACQYIEGVP